MRFASSIAAAADMRQALDRLLVPMDARVTPGDVDLVLLFATGHYDDELDDAVSKIASFFPSAVLIGCTAEGTIGGSKELERVPSLSLLAATLPDVSIRPFFMDQADLEQLSGPLDWERMVGASPESKPTFIALGDPFRFAILEFIEQLNIAYPKAPVVGGIASAGRTPRENRLWVSGETHREGVVGVSLTGRLEVQTVVSQGCRPIGRPFVITRAERNVIRELGGKPALEQLHHTLVDLEARDDKLARESLFVGRVIDEYKDRFTRGDFLIHNIIGVDRQSGALGIAGHARVGSTVQFHVRDAESADEDLRAMLSPYGKNQFEGAMLFDCNGRGTQMWPEPHHDITVLREMLGDVPTAGFFCGGEFGPVGGKNFVHGFTASIALFREPEPEKGNE